MTRSSGKPARRSAAGLTRTLRTGWWPRFLVAGVLLVVVGAMLLSGAAEAVVAGLGALIIYVTGVWSLSMSPGDYRREPPAYAVRSTWAVEGRGAASLHQRQDGDVHRGLRNLPSSRDSSDGRDGADTTVNSSAAGALAPSMNRPSAPRLVTCRSAGWYVPAG
jgi:hypothetical protein